MFHLLRANVTFSNIFALDESVRGVTAINDEITTACVLDETIFDFETPPPGYSVEGKRMIVLSCRSHSCDTSVSVIFLVHPFRNSLYPFQKEATKSGPSSTSESS